MYKLIKEKLFDGTLVDSKVILREDGAWIPMSEDNTDYQAYLAWCAEGNEPLPADKGVA